MFIYEFMAGLVDTIGGDEDSYDPHMHRKVPHPTSYSETMIHLLKGSIGAGILAMPEAISRLGLIPSSIVLVCVGVFATYCIQLLIDAQYILCKRWRRGYMAYPKSMRLALQEGPPCLRGAASAFYYFVDFVLVVWQLGICCIYAVFVSSNIKQVMDFHGIDISMRIHLCYLLIPLIIVNLVKDLKLMTPISTVSNLVTLFGLVLVFFYLVEDDLEVKPNMSNKLDFRELPIFIGTCLFALEAVGVVMALEYNMENPKQFVGLFGLFSIGMIFTMGLYLLVGIFGYLKYGDEIQASITLNLPAHEKKAQTAKIVFAIAIFLSFPLQNFVAYSIVWRKVKKKVPDTSPKRLMACDFAVRLLLVIIPWALAVAVPQLGPFISLFGALCLSLLAMVFPGLIDCCVRYPSDYGRCRFRLLRDVFIVFVGLLCCVAGCYSSILEIARDI